MQDIKTVLIDIREEFELLETQLITNNKNLLIVNIPTRAIFANKLWIDRLSNNNDVFLVCRSGNRSEKVKTMYFKENTNVISLNGGIKNIGRISEDIFVVNGKGGLGMQQYVQVAFVLFLIILLLLLFLNVNKNYLIAVVTIFVVFLVYQILTKGCLISSMLPLPTFVPIKTID